MLLEQLRVNTRYNFRLHASAILGAEIKRATLISTANLAVASMVDAGLAGKHAAAVPSLPAGTAKDASKLTYLLFTTEAGQTVALAYNWIIDNTIEESAVNKATFEIRISSADDLPRIAAILANAGFSVESSIIS